MVLHRAARVPRRHSWSLPPAECPHNKQLAFEVPEQARSRAAAVCPFTRTAVAWPHPLSLLIGSLAVIDSSCLSQWGMSHQRVGSVMHITGSRWGSLKYSGDWGDCCIEKVFFTFVHRKHEGKKPWAFTTTSTTTFYTQATQTMLCKINVSFCIHFAVSSNFMAKKNFSRTTVLKFVDEGFLKSMPTSHFCRELEVKLYCFLVLSFGFTRSFIFTKTYRTFNG